MRNEWKQTVQDAFCQHVNGYKGNRKLSTETSNDHQPLRQYAIWQTKHKKVRLTLFSSRACDSFALCISIARRQASKYLKIFPQEYTNNKISLTKVKLKGFVAILAFLFTSLISQEKHLFINKKLQFNLICLMHNN